MKESRKPFFLNLYCGSAARFMTSSKSFWVEDGMIFGRGRNELNDQKLTWLIKFFVIYTLVVDQKIVILQVPKFKSVDISQPIRFVFLLFCFRA